MEEEECFVCKNRLQVCTMLFSGVHYRCCFACVAHFLAGVLVGSVLFFLFTIHFLLIFFCLSVCLFVCLFICLVFFFFFFFFFFFSRCAAVQVHRRSWQPRRTSRSLPNSSHFWWTTWRASPLFLCLVAGCAQGSAWSLTTEGSGGWLRFCYGAWSLAFISRKVLHLFPHPPFFFISSFNQCCWWE